MTTTDTMRKAARAAIERPTPIPPAPAAPEVTDALAAILARLDRPAAAVEPAQPAPALLDALEAIRVQGVRQGQATAGLKSAVDALTARQEMTPPAAAACEVAASRMSKAADAVASGVGLLQEASQSAKAAAEEILDYREGRWRRLAAGLVLGAGLPSLMAVLWLAWRVGVL